VHQFGLLSPLLEGLIGFLNPASRHYFSLTEQTCSKGSIGAKMRWKAKRDKGYFLLDREGHIEAGPFLSSLMYSTPYNHIANIHEFHLVLTGDIYFY